MDSENGSHKIYCRLTYAQIMAPGNEGEGARPTPAQKETSEFLLRACHDLRTAVRAVRACAELLTKEGGAPTAADWEQRVGFIADGARQIDRVVDGISAYSLALQTEESAFVPVPLGALLRTALARLSQDIHEGGAEVTYDQLPRVPGNPDRLLELWESLLRHALQSGADPPRIHVGARLDAGEWLITVRDNGTLDPAAVEHLFRPFARSTGGAPEKAGLGLAICRTIVARHGGRMWAESLDGGTAVFFTLPAEQ